MEVLKGETNEARVKKFLEDYQHRLEATTLGGYELSVNLLLRFCKKPYYEITTADIRLWLMDLEKKEYKSSSIKKYMFGLRLFFQYCIEEELMAINPMEPIPLPQSEDKLPHFLTYEQLAELRELVSGQLKQRAVLEVFYATGIRLAELTNMLIADIQWTERIIRIPKGKGKKERIVLFTKECEAHLKAYLQTRTDDLPYLFLNRWKTGPIGRRGIQFWFKTYKEELDVYLTPHTMRHTFAAHLAIKGMPLSGIQAILGHEYQNNTHIYARLVGQAQKLKYDEWM